MRLFTAIAIPDEIKSELLKLFAPIDGVKWQNKSQIHLTLRFIGDANRQTADEIIKELKQVQVPPFEITLDQLGTFPERGKPRIIWIGVKQCERLHELHDQLERACRNVGLEPDNRSFNPHITLGRNKGSATKEIRKHIEQQTVPDLGAIQVKDFYLFSSELTPQGAEYHIEMKFPLT